MFKEEYERCKDDESGGAAKMLCYYAAGHGEVMFAEVRVRG